MRETGELGYHRRMLLLLLACASPTVSVTAAETDDLPMVAGFDETKGKLERSMHSCYTQALAADGKLSGTVTVDLTGSHGILKVTTDHEGPLAACATDPLMDARTQRALGDGDNTVGAQLTVVFSP